MAVVQSSPDIKTPWLAPSEAASYLRTTQGALYKLVQRGHLRAARLGRHLRFHRKDLDAFLRRDR